MSEGVTQVLSPVGAGHASCRWHAQGWTHRGQLAPLVAERVGQLLQQPAWQLGQRLLQALGGWAAQGQG